MSVYLPDEQGELTALDAANTIAQAAMQPGDLGAAFSKMFISLIAIVVLLFLSYWFLKRLIQNKVQKGVSNSSIQILEKRMISPKTMLYLVEVDQKKILLAESHLEVKRLESFEESHNG